ncbi:WD40 repeat-like protein, partial [Suillus brevipes Sb2]
MASTSTKAGTTESILPTSITLKGHGERIRSISCFPDGQQMISGSEDKTVRQWDVKTGKENKEAQNVCEEEVWAVAVSRDGGWVVTAGGDVDRGALKACEVETGNVRTFEGHSRKINCVDISVDNTLLASGADDFTARIWNLDTSKLVAGPFESIGMVGAVRFSTDSKKLALKSDVGKSIEIWDIESQKVDVRVGGYCEVAEGTRAPMFWTNNNKAILAAFSFTKDDPAHTIYEFDASTLETVGVPFEGHTKVITGITPSFDGALLASAGEDDTIKLWAWESRQLLASFDVRNPQIVVLSPDSRQLAYVTDTEDDYEICICDTPSDVLVQARGVAHDDTTMASASTKAASTKSILKPSITLKGHEDVIRSISYFPDGQRMISGSQDKTTRQWDVKAGKEIEEARGDCEQSVLAVAVSRNGRWVVSGGGDVDRAELKVCEVETGIVKTFKGHSNFITCVDISADNTRLASGSADRTARIWNLETGELVAGPFKRDNRVGAVRFSPDLKKLAVMSWSGRCLEVWDVQSQQLD